MQLKTQELCGRIFLNCDNRRGNLLTFRRDPKSWRHLGVSENEWRMIVVVMLKGRWN